MIIITGSSQVSVQPRVDLFRTLGADRLVKHNFRLNNSGRRTLTRINSDNPRVIKTRLGWQMYRKLENDEYNKKLVKVWSDFVPLGLYEPEVMKHYKDFGKISPRSEYYYHVSNPKAKGFHGWLQNLAFYGKNWKKAIDNRVARKLYNLMGELMDTWLSKESRTIEELLDEVDWLTHVRTGTNSGYPMNTPQDKALALRAMNVSYKIFKKYQRGDKIDWTGMAFMPGMRTERERKQRNIFMSSMFEKTLGALMNTIIDEHIDDFPVKLPRHYGALDLMNDEIIKTKKEGEAFICKDFDGFDTSIPLEFLKILAKYFKSKGTDFGDLLAFEVEAMINGVLIVAPTLGYKIYSMPSGIGGTQPIGSIIHKLIDMLADFVYSLSIYQSDDHLGITSMSEQEITACFDFINKELGMIISPLGEKSFYSETVAIILQTWITEIQGKLLHFGNEIRRWCNLFYRERFLNVPGEKLATKLGYEPEDKPFKHRVHAISFLGTLASLGLNAPTLPSIISRTYGKRSGYTWRQLEDVFPHLGMNLEGYEQINYIPAFITDTFRNLKSEYGYGRVTEAQVQSVLSNLGRVI